MLSRSKESLKTEKYPLPSTIEGITSMVREILSLGKVRRIELDVELPIKVVREIGDTGLSEPDIDIDSALRRVDLLETPSCSTSIETVLSMCRQIYRRNLRPSFWVIGSNALLEKWAHPAEIEFNAGHSLFLNVPLRLLKSLPEDTIILCGSQYKDADAEDVSFAIKTSMEIRRDYEPEPNSSSDDPIWGCPPERSSAISGLEIPSPGLRKVGGEV